MTASSGNRPAARNGAVKVHPIAALFPMSSPEELIDLAADIKARGLLDPIVLDEEGMLIDGRSRFRACELAGVEPRFVRFNGNDPVAFIFRQNAKRTHGDEGRTAWVAAQSQSASGPPAKRRGRSARTQAESLMG